MSEEIFSGKIDGLNIETEKNENYRDVLFFDAPYRTDQDIAYSQISDAGKNIDLPRGMVSIASYLKEQGISSSVIPLDSYLRPKLNELMVDGVFDQEKFKTAIEQIMDEKIGDGEKGPRVLAFGLMYTFVEPVVLEMTRYAKEKHPDKYVVVGGNHATFSDSELLDPENKTGIDIVVRYEGEVTMQELVSELSKPNPDLTQIKGISYRDSGGEIHKNDPRDRTDLYQMPSLDYKLVDSPESLDKFNQTAMFLRGCQGNCAFCTSPQYWDKKLTQGKVKNFETELYFLARNGVEIISVLDDDILASQESFGLVTDSLQKVKEKYPNIKFIAQTRVIHLRDKQKAEEYLNRMEEAGISRLYLGIESGSQDILNEMAKGYKVGWVEEALKTAHKFGIETGGFWLFGHPGSTREREEESLMFMEKMLKQGLLDDVEAHGVVPFPGTRIASDPRVQIFDQNKKHYGLLNNYPVYNLVKPETGEIILSAEEIKGFLNRSLELRKKYLGVDEDTANKPVA